LANKDNIDIIVADHVAMPAIYMARELKIPLVVSAPAPVAFYQEYGW
jgi:hypothetical protein